MSNSMAMGDLIEAIGRKDFGTALFGLISSALPATACSAYCFRPHRDPILVVSEGRNPSANAETGRDARCYADERFRSDPNPQDIFSLTRCRVRLFGIGQTRELLIQVYAQRDYFSISAMIAFDGQTEAGVLRAGKRLAKILGPALARHLKSRQLSPEWAMDSGPRAGGDDLFDHLAVVFSTDCQSLSLRESQVCAGTVLGLRTLGLSLKLGASENTISSYRKKAYSKLGITCQNELFGWYIRALMRLRANASASAPSSAPPARALVLQGCDV